jgi:hypothetical protein
MAGVCPRTNTNETEMETTRGGAGSAEPVKAADLGDQSQSAQRRVRWPCRGVDSG